MISCKRAVFCITGRHKVMRKQAFGGDILNIVSKNSVVSRAKQCGVRLCKSSTGTSYRLLAAELGSDKIM